jgi:hypothetical protein
MNFGSVPICDAEGAILAFSLAALTGTLAKDTKLSK